MRVTTPKILMNLGLLLCFVLSINGAQIYFGNAGSYSVFEGDFNALTSIDVNVCHSPSDTSSTAYIFTNDSTAEAGSDFEAIGSNTPVTIPAGMSCIFYTIAIISDMDPELTEQFYVQLSTSSPSDQVISELETIIVTIIDDDNPSEVEVSFSSGTYDIVEGDVPGQTSVEVDICHSPSNIPTTAYVSTVNGTAKSGLDFTPINFMAVTITGTCSPHIINIVSDENPEETEQFFIQLFSFQPSVQVSAEFGQAIIIINDDDRETIVGPCNSSPCQNGSTCMTVGNSYTCRCVTGFTGTNCETQMVTLPCVSSPCQNGGICMNEENGYMCQCLAGFTGTNCETQSVSQPCNSSPCQNEGTCANGENGYMCQCATGFTGTNCETFINLCDTLQCQNGGTCTPGLGLTYTCTCPDGFEGTVCEIGSEARIDSCPQMLVVPSGSPLEFTNPSCYDNSGTMYPSTCTPQSGTFIAGAMTTVTCQCGMQSLSQCMFDVTVGQVLMLGNRLKRSSADVSPSPSDMTSEEILTTVITESDDVSTTAMTVTSTTTVAPGTTPSITPTTTELNTTPFPSTVLATTELNTTPLSSTITATAELETTSLPVILTTIQELDTTPFIPSTVPVTPDLDTTLLPSTVPTTPVISNCEENPGICGENATCENITDGIQCKCNEGFSPSGSFAPTNSTICFDTDECEDGTHECVNEASCENTIGSYNCTCPRGFYENGLTENGRQDCKACNRSDGVEQKYGFNCSQPCTCVTGAACAKDTGSCSGPICMNLPTCNKNDLNVTVTTSPTNGEVPEGTIFFVTCAVNLPSTDVNVSWTGPNGEIMDNNAKYFIRRIQMSPPIERLQVNQANATDTGMYNCTATLNVPTDSVQFRTESADITVLDLPEIADLRAFPITSTSITLNWTIEDAGGDTLTCRANYTAEETIVTEVQDCSGNETCWLTNLSPYTPYNITVECRNTAGYSNALNTSERTDTSGPSAPQMPTVVDNSESCIVRWKDSEQSNGPDLHYEVNQFIKDAAKGGLDESSGPVEIKTGTKYEQQKANMRLNSIYTFEICAKNRDHKGDCVNASGSCTTNPGAPASIPTVALPEEDTAVNSTSVTLRVPQVDNRNGPISCYEFVVVKRKNGKPVYASPDEVEFEKIQNETGENGLPYRSVVMNHDDYVSKETVTIGSEANTKTTCMLVASRRRRRANTVEGGKQLTAINSPLESDTSYDIFMRSYSETSGGMFQYASSEFVNVSTAPGDGSSAGLIVSLIILILLIIVVSIVLFIFWQKRNSPDKTHSVVLPMVTTTNGGGADHFDGKNKGFEDDEVISEVPPINIDQLGESILEKHKQSDKLFFAEFRSLMSTNPEATIEEFNNVANKDKNRYINIPCYDHSRVKLNKIGGDENSDYINANYVDGYSVPEKFIAAQGPKEETVEDFWRMIWEQKTKTIIMLTRCFESGRDKCFQYWPDSGQVTHGKFTICLDNTLECPDYVIRQFRLSMNKESDEDDDGESETRMVMQFHFLAWPDHGVPEYPYAMLAFIKRIRQMTQNKPEKGQIVIHCSAGVGRTGTYITIDAMLDRLNEEKTVDIFNFIQKIRLQRSTLVQSQVQYVFIYHALHEEHLYGHTEVRLNDLKQYFRRLKLKTLQDDNSPLHIEFKTAATLPVKDTSTKEASKLGNKEKNRIRNYLPYDKNRVNLERLVGDEDSTYINASYINGYERRNMYIITQAPMENTASDFWRMVWDSLTSTVVMLTDLEEKGNEMCVKFWPEEEPKTFGNLTIELTEQEEEESFTIKDFTMSNNQGVSGRKVRMYQFHGWPEIGVPDCDSVTHLVTLSHEYQRVAEEEESVDQSKHPIIVFCHTGVGRTAIWCALSILLERAKAEGVVDVFQTVRTLRQQRQHMVQDTTQYEFLYQAVLSHLGKLDDLYENLQS